MGLSKKTFLYSIALAAGMAAFITGYFIFMLPSLYVDYVMRSNLSSVEEIHRGYIKSRTYDGLAVKNPSATYSLEVPREGSQIYVTGKFFRMKVEIKDEELQKLFYTARQRIGREGTEEAGAAEGVSGEEFSFFWEQVKEKFTENTLLPEDYPVAVTVEGRENPGVYRDEYSRLHRIGEDLAVYEAGVSDGNYGYTTYIAMGQTKDAFIFTVLPTMTPRMEEITPVVMGSMPMITAVVFLLALLPSRYFSGKIVNPIIRLAGYAQSAKGAAHFEGAVFEPEGEDEVGTLGQALKELYGELGRSYRELERKNGILEEENQRQEVFLRSAAHQLKTPIAAALLLVEGMRGGVGKYQDAKAYLPEVKKQLMAMSGIVEEVLHLNCRPGEGQEEEVAMETLTDALVQGYRIQTEDKGLKVTQKGAGTVFGNRDMMSKIVDNLLSNAVQYTPPGERIEIEISGKSLQVKNYGITIEEKLLPAVFEPFVSSDTERRGKGLGLYVAAYYSRLLGWELTVENMENGVRSLLVFTQAEAELE